MKSEMVYSEVRVGVPLLAVALWRRSSELKATASVLLILSALTAIPAFLSGEPAEEIIEHRPGVSKTVIHEHEEAGEFTLIAIGILGGLVLAAGLFEKFKKPLPSGAWWCAGPPTGGAAEKHEKEGRDD